MSRLLAVCLAFGTAQLGVACHNEDSRAEAAGGVKVDAPPSDIVRARDEYRRQKQADLAWLDEGIANIEAKERSLSATAKTDYHGAVASLKAEREVFARDVRTMDVAVDSTWDATKASLDAKWTHLKAATEKALGTRAPGSATYKPAQMTCDEFVALAEVERPKVLYWAEGFNQKGKATGAVVDVRESDRWLPSIVAECTASPKESLAKVVEKHAAAAPKPAAAAPAPGTMTCSEFVTYEDTSRPKLVYWAEGFNKQGDATVAEMDIDATDRLVPTLEEDCKATPKLALRERMNKHL